MRLKPGTRSLAVNDTPAPKPDVPVSEIIFTKEEAEKIRGCIALNATMPEPMNEDMLVGILAREILARRQTGVPQTPVPG